MMTSSLTEALGWTLLHSLWQATLVAGAFYLVRQVILHRPAQVYTAALGALLVVVGWSLHTFVDLYQTQSAVVTRPAPTLNPAITPPAVTAFAPMAKQPIDSSWLATAVAWMHQYVNFVALGWLLGMVILSARLAGGLWYLARLRHHHTCPLPAWEATVTTLATRLRLRRPVTAVVSGMAKVPMVIGHLKPIILLPVALLSSLPPEQIEAIIAHELAHVRRHDYWINMLQSLIEINFFYHPAVRWLSSVVREEREKCCDDLAVSLLNGNTVAYARALSEAESLQHAPTPLALAFAPRRGSLLARIERLVHPRTSSTSLAAKAVALVPMLLLATYLAGGDTLARKAVNSEPPFGTSSPQGLSIPAQSDSTQSTEKAAVVSSQPTVAEAPTADARFPSDTIPRGNRDEDRPGRVSFHFGDSSDFSFGMDFSFDDDDRTGQQGFRHWRFSSSDTFPNFVWNDSLWRESVEELGETMEAFSEELATYLEDSVDTEALQQRMNSVQRELSRVQAELGTSMQQTFSEEKMEALQKKLQREQERLGRDFQEKSRRLQERHQRFQEEQQRLNEEKSQRLKEIQRGLEERQQWFNEENNQRLEESQEDLDEMPPQSSDEENEWRNEANNQKLEEVQRALEAMPEKFKNENQEESRQRLEEVQQALEEMQQHQADARTQEQVPARMGNNFDDTVDRLEKELLADGLIKSGKEYRFELKPKGLYINRKKQAEEVLQKYRDLLQVSENTSFSIARTAQ